MITGSSIEIHFDISITPANFSVKRSIPVWRKVDRFKIVAWMMGI
jgi:hypothetical protein